MIKKRRLSCGFFAVLDYFVFEGYYDVTDDWTNIEVCYVNELTMTGLIAYFSTVSASMLQPVDIELREVVTNQGYKKLYVLMAAHTSIGSFFDYDNYTDKRMFTRAHIYEAILHGLQEGMAAGARGVDTINGFSPAEYAWLYSADLEDPLLEFVEIGFPFNREVYLNDVAFAFSHVHAAVIHGINQGYAAAVNSAEMIGGITPSRYAFQYASNPQDPIEQLTHNLFKLKTTT